MMTAQYPVNHLNHRSNKDSLNYYTNSHLTGLNDQLSNKSVSYSLGKNCKTTPSHSQTQRKSLEKWVCLDTEMLEKKNFDLTRGALVNKERRKQSKEVYLANKVLNSDRRGKNLSESKSILSENKTIDDDLQASCPHLKISRQNSLSPNNINVPFTRNPNYMIANNSGIKVLDT